MVMVMHDYSIIVLHVGYRNAALVYCSNSGNGLGSDQQLAMTLNQLRFS